MSAIERFFGDIDAGWRVAGKRFQLRLIGSTALMLQADYERGTKDSDVIETDELTPSVKAELLRLGRFGSTLQKRHRLYIDVVGRGVPFLPQVPLWHRDPMSASLRHFDLLVLDVIDVVVSKLKRFNAADQSDIEAMIDRDLVPHEALLERFRGAIDYNSMDARAVDFPRYVEYLNRVERDLLGVGETEIELPPWI